MEAENKKHEEESKGLAKAMSQARKDCDSPLTLKLNIQEKVHQHTGRVVGVGVGVQERANVCYGAYELDI